MPVDFRTIPITRGLKIMRLPTTYRTICIGIAACAILASFVTTASASGEFEIHKNFVKYEGQRYFRFKSHAIELGSFGKKLTPVFGANGLDPEGSFRHLLKGNWDKSEKIKATDYRKTKVKVSGKLTGIAGLFKLSGDDFAEIIKSSRCQFRPYWIKNHGRFERELNARPGALDRIKDNKSRIVNEVLVVDRCKITDKMKAKHDGKFEGNIKGNVLEINSDVDLESSGEVKLQKGSVLGYILREPVWNKKAKKKRSAIVDLKPDQHGLN